MSTQTATIVQCLWNYCNVLRDDGVSYGDYVDQQRWQAVLKQTFERRLVLQDRPSLF
jgi:type I restriction enzyme M protein